MRAGQLRERVTFQQKAGTSDVWGQPAEVWVDVMPPVAADVRFLSGLETVRAGERESIATGSVRVRKRAISSAWRLVYKGLPYEVTAVLPGLEYVDVTIKGPVS